MANFYKDNPDIAELIDALDLSEVARLREADFTFTKDFDFAPADAAEAIDNYKRALDICGDIAGNRIAPTAEETDKVGNVLNADGTVTYAPGIQLALDLYGQSGLMGATIPYYLGGLNMPCTILTALNDIVSRADCGLMNMFGLQGIAETINSFASEEIKKEYVPDLCSGRKTGAMVLTEPDAGSDLQSVKTIAYQDADGNWFVNGVKRFITNGCGDVLLVLCRTEAGTTNGAGLSCLLVEKGPHVKVRRLEHKLGINGSPTCELVFTEAPAKLIGQRRRGLITYVMALMNGARVGISAQACGVGEASYRAARDYAASRKQFGVTIDTFPALRELLSDMYVDLQAARALAYYGSKCVDLEGGYARLADEQKGQPEGMTFRKLLKRYAGFNKMLTPMAKYYASEMSMRTSNGAVSVLGGSGYMKDYPVERYLRDARITTIYEGTSQLQVVAAIAGVMGGTVRAVVEDILAGVDVPDALQTKRADVEALLADLEAAVAQVKDAPAGKDYHDLHARRLVDAAIAVIVGALFIRLAAKNAARTAQLDYWVATRWPIVRAGLAIATSGYIACVTDFEKLAPAVPAAE